MSEATSLISAHELNLSFGNHAVLEGATMAIYPGEKVGLVGRNGSGKSSLLRILAGTEQADSGSVSRRNGLVCGYLPQEFALDDAKSVMENVRDGAAEVIALIHRYETEDLGPDQMAEIANHIEAAEGWTLDHRLDILHQKLNLPPRDRSVAQLSGGEKRRVALARSLAAQPDLLILDEPTNHLDTETINWLEDYLRARAGACLFVTHDRYFLDRLATRIIEVSEAKCFTHDGNYNDYLEAKMVRMQQAQNTEARRQSYLRRELSWVRAGVKARGSKARSRLDTYYEVAGQKAPEDELDMDLIIPTPPQLGNIVVEADDLGMAIGDQVLFSGLDLRFEANSITGVVGRNGLGKTTLLRALMGDLEPTWGNVRIGKKTHFNYVDQARVALNEEVSVLDEVSDQAETVRLGEETISVRAYLRRFLFTDERINTRVELLSGGEKSRLMLAKILRRSGNVLILDEPTNDLDLPTLRLLEEALLSFPGCVIAVSHDRYFLDRVCDQIISFEGERSVHVSTGNYSYYLEKRNERSLPGSTGGVRGPKGEHRLAERPRKLKWKEERELETMEETILALEAKVEELDAKLNDPEFFVANSSQTPALIEELEKNRQSVAATYERWAELEAIQKAHTEFKQKST